MPKIPSLTAKQIIRALKSAGFIEERQKGSHLILRNPRTNAITVVPVHAGKTVKRPLVRAIIDDAGLSAGEFLKLL